MEIAGIEDGEQLPGVSAAPVIFGESCNSQNDVLLGLASWRGLYNGRYFYSIDNRSGQVQPVKLIDVVNDPYDQHNLLDDPAYQKTVQQMHDRLINRLEMVGDTQFLQSRRLEH